MSSGCGCKEVNRFPHITYPYSSCIFSFFAAASLLFVHFFNVISKQSNCYRYIHVPLIMIFMLH